MNPRPRTLRAVGFSVFLASIVGACALLPTAQDSEPAPALPDHFANREPTGPYQPNAWWKAFDDPVLDRVIEAVLDSNFDLAAAVARVDQARARAHIAVAPRFPSVHSSLGVNVFDAPTNTGFGAQLDDLGLGPDVFESFGFMLPERLDLTTYSIGADYAYEADFWGRARNDARAAGAERLASEADFRAARIGVLAQTVATYLEVVDLRCQRGLASETVNILAEQEALAAARYDGGVADIRALYAARRSLRDAQAELPRFEGRLADAEGRLWAVLGGYRQDLEDVLPDALSPAAAAARVLAGIPADLLGQRPDVSAARRRVEAARYAADARRAELLPSLSLSGSIGLQSSESNDWFDPEQWFKNLSVNLLAPVFQGGRLRGRVALAEARLDEAVAAFGQSVVTAVHEVEAALAGLDSSRRRVELLAAFVAEAEAEADLQEQRYLSGVGDYAVFLAASQILVGAKSALAGGRRDLGFAQLALHRALGGAWVADGLAGRPSAGASSAAGAQFLLASTE